MPANPLQEFVERYGPKAGEEGVVLFAAEVFGVTLDPWQERVARAYGRGERRISIRACHGPGKTFLAALLTWHQFLCRFPQHTVATAPSRSQLEDALFKEVLTLYTKLPEALQALFEVKKNRIELLAAPEESFFSARTARAEKPEALQGVHCDGGFVLLIADEASGIDEAIFEAAAGSMSGHNATTLLLSNPVRSSGFFFDTHHRNAGMWFTVHVSHADSSRVSQDFVDYIAAQFGENSNAFRIRALGEFPLADDDTIIPYELIRAAQERDIVVLPTLREVWGLDVARFGGDDNVLVRRNKLAVLPRIEKWGGTDLMQTAGRVKKLWDETEPSKRPDEILIDVIGLGSGVVDRLLELKLPVRGINVSETASVHDGYRNLRTELWFRCREWLATRNHALPKCDGTCTSIRDCVHERLVSEMASLRFAYTSTGKMLAESKADVKKRTNGISPDVADALMLTFASEPAALLHGSKNDRVWSTNWHEPIRRGRVVV